MNARSPKRLIALFSLFALAAAVFGGYVYSRTDHFPTLPAQPGEILDIRNGICYAIVVKGNHVQLVATTLKTNSSKVLCDDDITSFRVTNGEVDGAWYYYSLINASNPSMNFAVSSSFGYQGAMGGFPGGVAESGTFKSEKPPLIWKGKAPLGPPNEEEILEQTRQWRRMPLAGGSAEKLAVQPAGQRRSWHCVNGEFWWIDRSQSRTNSVIERGVRRNEITTGRRLMVQQNGQAPRVFYTGVVDWMTVVASKYQSAARRVFWTEPRVYPDVGKDLLFDTGIPGRWGKIKDVGRGMTLPPVELNGRLYWIAYPVVPSGLGSSSVAQELYSISVDGSDQRSHGSLDSGIVVRTASLRESSGKLYVLYKMGYDEPNNPTAKKLPLYLGEVDLASGKIAERCKLPNDEQVVWIDGVDVYGLMPAKPGVQPYEYPLYRVEMKNER
jgi:hypothetical protein